MATPSPTVTRNPDARAGAADRHWLHAAHRVDGRLAAAVLRRRVRGRLTGGVDVCERDLDWLKPVLGAEELKRVQLAEKIFVVAVESDCKLVEEPYGAENALNAI